MPASAAALDAAGLEAKAGEFANSNLVGDANLGLLGDVFRHPGRLARGERVQRGRSPDRGRGLPRPPSAGGSRLGWAARPGAQSR